MAEAFPAAELVVKLLVVGFLDRDDERANGMKVISGALTVVTPPVRLKESPHAAFDVWICDFIGHGFPFST